MKSDAQIGGALHPLPPANTLKELEARLAKMDSARDAIQARIRVLRESAASVETDVARPVSSKTFPNLQHKVERLVVLHGGMGQKKRRAAWDVLQTTAASTRRLATRLWSPLFWILSDARQTRPTHDRKSCAALCWPMGCRTRKVRRE